YPQSGAHDCRFSRRRAGRRGTLGRGHSVPRAGPQVRATYPVVIKNLGKSDTTSSFLNTRLLSHAVKPPAREPERDPARFGLLFAWRSDRNTHHLTGSLREGRT